MNMRFYRKLPIPKEIKEQFPVSEEITAIREKRLAEMREIFSGKSNRFLLIIGPCSADREDAVMDYIYRLKDVQEEVGDKIMIVPRVYTNKPRTTGDGYKGLFSQPNPDAAPDLLSGVIAMRSLHMKAIKETGFCCADEMLYPENHRYLSDLIGYVAIGARSVENQQHRLTASGLNIPVGMKNPTSGDITVMMNSIKAAHHKHIFCYRGWEVETRAILTRTPFCAATWISSDARIPITTTRILPISPKFTERADLKIRPPSLTPTTQTPTKNTSSRFVFQRKFFTAAAIPPTCRSLLRA